MGLVRRSSALVNGQGAFIQLHDRQMARSGKERADVTLRPAAVRVLPPREIVENDVAIIAPGQPFTGWSFGKHLGVAIVAQHIQGLGVIVVRILPMPKTIVAALVDWNRTLAKLDPLLGQLGFVLAGTEHTGNGGRGQWWPFAAVERPAVRQAINHP